MDISKVRMIFGNLRFIKYFSQNTTISTLGRWKVKDMEQTEYYMTKMHADPGYQFLHTIERNKIFENESKKSKLN
jgi:hypothetical protein